MAGEHGYVQDAEVRVERGDDISEAVEPMVRWLRELDDRMGELDGHRPAESISRPAGAAVDARYAACEAWLTADLEQDSGVRSWRGANLADRVRTSELLDQAGSLDEAAALLVEYRRQVAESVTDRDVRAWVLQRFADEGGMDALDADRARIQNAQQGLFAELQSQLDDDLFYRWQSLFKGIGWSDTVNLTVPTPEGPRLQTVLRHSSLGQLAELVDKLAGRHLLSPASVTAFVIAGRRVEIAASTGSASMGRRTPQPSPAGRITMTVDAALSPEQIAGSFRRMRDSVCEVRAAATEKQGRMVEHVVGRVEYGFENLPWAKAPRTGPGRRPTSDGPRFCVQPIRGESWSRIVSDWNGKPALAQLGRLNAAHASRDFTAAFIAVFQPLVGT